MDRVLERLGQLHPKLIDLSLGRVERLLHKLDNPQDKLAPVVHVAGTNGKGSLIAYMKAGLEAAGYVVHVYTSPHLVRFNERIVVSGEEIADSDLIALLEECEDANAGEPVTFFEITTAAALLAFSRAACDVVLMETGLGGRLDATNMIARPALTAITPVSMDHRQFLGDELAGVAAEKAGILKPGVACVVAAQEPEALRTIEARALEVGAPLYVEGREWSVQEENAGMIFDGRAFPAPGLIGAHQIRNAGMAVACLERLDGFEVDDEAVAAGLESAVWPGRLQRMEKGPLAEALPTGWELWADGGHNPAAARALAAQAKSWKDRPLHLILGMMEGKDPAAFLDPLADCMESIRAVTVPGEDGSLAAKDVADAAKGLGMEARASGDVASALGDIAETSPGAARVLICGSLYLVGSVLRSVPGWSESPKVIRQPGKTDRFY